MSVGTIGVLRDDHQLTGGPVRPPEATLGGGLLELLLRPVPRMLVLAVAVLSAVPLMFALAGLAGVPSSATEWLAYALPVGLGFAVLWVRRSPPTAMTVLILATALGMPADAVIENGPPVLAGLLLILIWTGACWVVCVLGAHSRWPWSVALMVVWAIVIVVEPGEPDAAFLVVTGGWWAVGLIIRSRRRTADRLIIRASELAAEEERFTAEAVRLERATIARELHDVVAHRMTVIVIQAQAARQLLDRDPAAATEAIEAIVASSREAEADVGALVALTNPDKTEPLTHRMVEDLVTRASAAGSRVELAMIDDPADLQPDLAVATHRALQEALTNVFRHAPGAWIRITLTTDPYCLAVTSGAPATESTMARLGTGHGLVGIQDRMGALGLTTRYGATAAGGWELIVER